MAILSRLGLEVIVTKLWLLAMKFKINYLLYYYQILFVLCVINLKYNKKYTMCTQREG